MKKQILLLIVGIYTLFGMNFAYGASYVPLPGSADGIHEIYIDNLQTSVTTYLDNNGGQIGNIDDVRVIVHNSIRSQGGWGPDYQMPYSHWLTLARVVNGQLVVGCGNADFLSYAVNPTSVTPNSYTVGGTCATYISGWDTNWGDCSINGDWSSDGKINCRQTNTWIEKAPSNCGVNTYNSVTTCYGDTCTTSPSSYSCDTSTCPLTPPRPANTYANTIVTANIDSPVSTCKGVYANDSTTCGFHIDITGPTLPGSLGQSRNITGINGLIVKNITDGSNQASNRIDGVFNKNTNNALNFNNVTNTSIAGTGKSFYIDISGIKARSPFKLDSGKITIDLQGKTKYTSININTISYDFLKPFVGKLDSSLNGIAWGKSPVLGTIMNYKLNLIEKSNLLINDLVNYKLSLSNSNIKTSGVDASKLELQDVKIDTNSFYDKIGSLFSARVNTSNAVLTSLPIPGLEVVSSYIEYKIGTHSVKYILSDNTDSNGNTPIKINGTTFLGVKIIGNLQGSGKQTITGQNKNFSDISKIETRTEIRKNAFSLIKGMKNGDVVNNIKYVEGDITISGNPTYETLIVKNGNVIISNDLNSSNKKFGIIVLKDNYDVLTDYNKKGNVYIDNGVKYLNSAIYADGGLISSNNKIPYTTDSSSRTNNLQDQLTLKGTLFTRNTIGGAILAGGSYLLPGGSTSSDFDKSMVYDLNYIRRGNTGCDKNGNGNCTDSGEYKDPFIIIYNPEIQINPPKGFGK